MNRDEVQQRLAEIQEQKRKLEALELAYAMVAEDQAALSTPITEEPLAPPSQAVVQTPVYPPLPVVFKKFAHSKSLSIRKAIESIDGYFTIDDVIAKLGEQNVTIPRNDVSFALSRFRKSGEIFVVKQGAGKIPSLYTKEDPEQLL